MEDTRYTPDSLSELRERLRALEERVNVVEARLEARDEETHQKFLAAWKEVVEG